MNRKFLCCFPLRVGNIVFGYIVIIIAIGVMAYNLFCLGMTLVPEETRLVNGTTPNSQEKFRNWENVEQLFGQDRDTLVIAVTLIYYLSYLVVSLFLFIFGALFVCGAYNANYCLVSTFFIYCFLHLFLTVILVVFEATSGGYIQLGLIIASDILLIICLFGVRYLIEAIQRGNIYSQPGQVLTRFEY